MDHCSKKIGIYKIENNINKKCYIGQSWDIENRWATEKKGVCNTHLKNAFKKYGQENFTFSILRTFADSGITQIMLDAFEDYYINMHNSIQCGYNKKHGGLGGKHSDETISKISLANKGKKRSKETREKLSKYRTGKKHSDQSKAKMSKTRTGLKRPPMKPENKIHLSLLRTGEKNPMYGKKHTDATIEKLKEYRAGDKNVMYGKHGWENPNSKPVVCIETGIVYPNAKEAALNNNLATPGGITAVCKGRKNRITAGGYHWAYASVDSA